MEDVDTLMASLGLTAELSPKPAPANIQVSAKPPAAVSSPSPEVSVSSEVDDLMAQLGLVDSASKTPSSPVTSRAVSSPASVRTASAPGTPKSTPASPKPAAAAVDDLISQLGISLPTPGSPAVPVSAGPGRAAASSGPGGVRGVSSGPGRGISSGPGRGGSCGPGLGRARGGMSSGPGAAAKSTAPPQDDIVPALFNPEGQKLEFKGPDCAACGKMVLGKIFSACDKDFHPQCFKCFHCKNQILEGEAFVEADDGHVYCEPDFFSLFGEKCAACKQPVTDSCIRFKDVVYHPNHFVCAGCGVQLRNQPFKEDDGEPFCLTCKKNRMKTKPGKAEICGKCKRPILGEYIILNGQKIHPEHYRCEECGGEFLGGNCHEYEGKNYCSDCYDKLLKSTCGKCAKPISGRSVTAIGRVWHPECFCCTVCLEPFSTSSFFENDGQPYCQFHYYKLFGKLCSKCQQTVMGDGVNALGKVWHPQCWVCSGCGTSLKKKVYEFEGKPHCNKCYDKLPKEIRKKIEERKKAEKNAKKATSAPKK